MKKLLFALLIISLFSISCSDSNNSEEESNEDYIDIISVEPAVGTEGEEVSFIITCDVRLVSKTSGSIFIGFNSNPETPDKYIVKLVAELADRYEGRLRFDLAGYDLPIYPIFYEEPESFNIYANLSPFIQTSYETWSPLSVDTCPISVNESIYHDNKELVGEYAECDFLVCNGRYNSERD